MEPNESMNRSRHEPQRNRTGTNRFAVHKVIFEPMRIDANHGNPVIIENVNVKGIHIPSIPSFRPRHPWHRSGRSFPRCTALAPVLAPTLVLALGRGAGLGDTRLGHAQLQRQVLWELKGGSTGGFDRS